MSRTQVQARQTRCTLLVAALAVGGCESVRVTVPVSCERGFTRCGERCVDLSADPLHCGDCGQSCVRPNTETACTDGSCLMVACRPGFAVCNGDESHGCMVDTRVDPNHCGDCETICTFDHAVAQCRAGRCVMGPCERCFIDANGLSSDGCEASGVNSDGECWFPFVVPSRLAATSFVDIGALTLDAPAGRHGFLHRDGDELVFDDGTTVRFWGVGIPGAMEIPERAAEYAERLRFLGVNLVRFHGLDQVAPGGLVAKNPYLAAEDQTTRELDPAMLDRLDRLVAELGPRGIYTDINLLVMRKFTAGDGVVDPEGLLEVDRLAGKPASVFDPQLIALQQEFASQVLMRTNPYTGLVYAEDPAVAVIEVTNENALFRYWNRGTLDRRDALVGVSRPVLPERYLTLLDDRWNEWLHQRYGTTEATLAAWHAEPATEVTLVASNDLSAWEFSSSDNAVRNLTVEGDTHHFHSDAVAEYGWQARLDTITDIDAGAVYRLEFEAWAEAETELEVQVMMDVDPWRLLGIREAVTVRQDPHTYRLIFAGLETFSPARVAFNLGLAQGDVYLRGLTLSRISALDVRDDEHRDGFAFDRPTHADQAAYPERRIRDLVEFYVAVEESYVAEMTSFLRDTMGFDGLISVFNNHYGLSTPFASRHDDFANPHGYWDHPGWFEDERWQTSHFKMYADSMFSTPERNTILRYSISRVVGQPFVVSEWNSSFFNPYQYELPFFLATYGTFQHWNGALIHQMGPIDNHPEELAAPSFFNSFADPQKTTLFAVAGLVFQRGLVSPSRDQVILPCTVEDIYEDQVFHHGAPGAGYQFPLRYGIDPLVALRSRIGLDFAGAAATPVPEIADPGTIVSDTGEVTFSPDRRLLLVDSPALNLAVGDLSERRSLTYLEVEAESEGAVLVASLNEETLAHSHRVLVYAVSEVQNTGQSCVLDEDRSGQDAYRCERGVAPTVLKDISASLELRGLVGGLTLFSLTEQGGVAGEIMVDEPTPGRYRFPTPAGTVWSVLTDAELGPSARVAASPTRGKAPLAVTFDAVIDRGTGEIAEVDWGFGDGTHSREPSPIHVFATVGTHEVTLTVEDENGFAVEARGEVVVLPAQSPPTISDTPARSVRVGETLRLVIPADDPDNPNLFANGGFEDGLKDWHIIEASEMTPRVVDSDPLGGLWCVEVASSGELGSVLRSEYLPVTPDADYVLQTFAKGDGVTRGEESWHRFCQIGRFYDATMEALGPPYPDLCFSEGTFDWQAHSTTFHTPAAAAYYRSTSLGIVRTGTGRGWVDAVTLRRADGEVLQFVGHSLPAGATLDPNTGFLEWTPSAGQEGEHDLRITVSDGTLESTTDLRVVVAP